MTRFTDHPNFRELIEKFENSSENFALFIGAGLSAKRFPTWPDVLTRLVEYCASRGKLRFSKEELLAEIKQENYYLEIASFCAASLEENDYHEFLVEQFGGDVEYKNIPKAYRAFLELGIPIVITTNYDRIPESFGSSREIYTPLKLAGAFAALRENRSLLLKMHGDIRDLDSIVFTYKDYTNLYKNEQLREFVKTYFGSKIVLFVGFGFSDPHLHQVLSYLHSITGEKAHYAFIEHTSDFKLAALEERYGIKLIPYTNDSGNYSEVDEFVDELSRINRNRLARETAMTSRLRHLAEDLGTVEDQRQFVESCVRYVEEHKESETQAFAALEAVVDILMKSLEVASGLNDHDSVMRMVEILGRQPNGFLELRGHGQKAIRAYELGTVAAQANGDHKDAGVCMLNSGKILKQQGLLDAAQKTLREAASFFDPKEHAGELSDAYHLMGMVAISQGNFKESERLHRKALKIREACHDDLGVAFSKHEMGRLARVQGRFTKARKLLEQSMLGWVDLGETNDRRAPTLHERGMLSLDEGDWRRHHDDLKAADDCYKTAQKLFEQSLAFKRALGMKWAEANTLNELGRVARVQSKFDIAHEYFAESLKIKQDLTPPDELGIAHTYLASARLLIDEGETSEARRLAQISMETYQKYENSEGIAAATYISGLIAMHEGDNLEAKRLFTEALAAWEALGSYRTFYAHKRLNEVAERLK